MNLKIFLLVALGAIAPGVAPAVAAPQDTPVTIRFTAKVGKQAFNCQSSYRLGKGSAKYSASDFRFYISDVALVDKSGKTVPVTLEQDGKWQFQNVALLDFEDKTGACSNGTVEVRDRIVGTVPKGEYAGLKFTLGVPSTLNHEDAAIAASPLNLTSLWWNWRSGYKFLRIDLQASNAVAKLHSGSHKQHGAGEAKSSGFPIHLGSTGCEEDSTSVEKTTTCSNPNRTSVSFNKFDTAKNVVVADLKQLVSGSKIGQNQPQTPPGCMSEPNDGDCANIMKNLGLPFAQKSAPTQKFFRFE